MTDKKIGELERRLLKAWENLEVSGTGMDTVVRHNPLIALENIIAEVREDWKEQCTYLIFNPEYSKSDPYITHQKWTLDGKNAFLKTRRDEWYHKWIGEEE